ncbi:MAG TPA: insulinase family protein [Spirochaetia bacterium]|nr:insulinase family protein [Spirochaetia bacterium]
MKRILRVSILLTVILLIPGFLFGAGAKEYVRTHASGAAPGDDSPLLPLSPEITRGKLPNGLTYYIRKNSEPTNRASFRLVVNAGSILEDDDQQGLAHFLEHMAFNGTEKYAKNDVIKFLESLGMEFGPDTNAFTSFDETVYRLDAATDRPDTVERCVDVLAQWAGHMTLSGTEIDKERGVIMEEWRLGRGAQTRMQQAQFPILFKGSRYSERLPIGKPEIIQNFSHDTLRRFYHDWYRPDLMAVVAVGDFSKEDVERYIRHYFSDLKNPTPERTRFLYPVPDHAQTLYAPAADPEASYNTVSIYSLNAPERLITENDYHKMLAERLFESMINTRYDAEAQNAAGPFLFAAASTGSIVRTKSGHTLAAMVKPDSITTGLTALTTEAYRVRKLGFTQDELDRAKTDLLRGMQQAYNERDKTSSASFASEYVRNFLTREAAPGISYEYELYVRLLPQIRLDEVNALAESYLRPTNRVVLVNAVQTKEFSMPTDSQLASAVASGESAKVEQISQTDLSRPLMPEAPVPGKIVSEQKIDSVGLVHWTLSNGASVYLKPTTYKNDQIVFGAYSKGGTSLVPDDEFIAATQAAAIAEQSGLGDFDSIDLTKKLSGKQVSISPYINSLTEGLNGSSSTEDAQTLFQLINLTFTHPRFDRNAYDIYIQRLKAKIENQDQQPAFRFSEKINRMVMNDNFRSRPLDIDRIGQISFEKVREVYQDRFADPGKFVYVFAGNIDLAKFRELVSRYIAGMPGGTREETFKDRGLRFADGVQTASVKAGSEPRSEVSIIFTGQRKWTRTNEYLLQATAEILTMKLLEVIREDKSAAYSIGAQSQWNQYPIGQYIFEIDYGADPAKAKALSDQVFAIIDEMKKQPLEESYVERVQATEQSAYESAIQDNGFWVQNLKNLSFYERPFDDILTYPDLIKSLTPEKIRATAAELLDQNRYVRVILYPANWTGD